MAKGRSSKNKKTKGGIKAGIEEKYERFVTRSRIPVLVDTDIDLDAGADSSSGTNQESAGRRRVFSAVNEHRLSKILVVMSFILAVATGIALIIISAGSSGRELSSAQSASVRHAVPQPKSDGDEGGLMTVSVAGAVKLQEEILSAARTSTGYGFSNYLSDMSGVLASDVSVAGIIGTMDESRPVSGYPSANYPAALADSLSALGINAAAVASPFYAVSDTDCVLASCAAADERGVVPVGISAYSENEEDVSGTDAPSAPSWRLWEKDGITVGVGSYCCMTSAELEARGTADEETVLAPLEIATAYKTISEDVSAMREAGADFTVIYIYWGADGFTSPSMEMRSLASCMIEAGVDVTVGIGPDFPQAVEKLSSPATGKDCYVFYSLGNFFSAPYSGENECAQISFSLRFTLERLPGSSEVSVSKAEYVPVYCYRDRRYTEETTYMAYRVIPAQPFAEAAALPEIFPDEAEWVHFKAGYIYIRSLAGSKITLGSPVPAPPADEQEGQPAVPDVNISI